MNKQTDNPHIGLGVIGVGMAAQPHGKSLVDLRASVDVRGVYSRTREKRETFAQQFGFPVAESIDALVNDDQLHAVLLLTPPDQRIELVQRFAEAGKHILTEKPLERTTAAAEKVVAICQHNNVELGVVFQHRYRDVSQKLKALIDDEVLGAVCAARVVVPWWREQAYYDEPGRGTYARDGGGVLISQAIHTLDLMLSLTGAVTEVQAITATTKLHKMESEDFVAGGLRFANGAPGSIVATTAGYPGEAEAITLDCELASAHLARGKLTVHWQDGRTEEFGQSAVTGGGADPMAFPYDWHKSVISDFAEAVRVGRSPSVTGVDALQVHRLIDALVSSSQSRRVVEISAT